MSLLLPIEIEASDTRQVITTATMRANIVALILAATTSVAASAMEGTGKDVVKITSGIKNDHLTLWLPTLKYGPMDTITSSVDGQVYDITGDRFKIHADGCIVHPVDSPDIEGICIDDKNKRGHIMWRRPKKVCLHQVYREIDPESCDLNKQDQLCKLNIQYESAPCDW